MGLYSVRGSGAFDARLDRDFAHVVHALAQSEDAALCRALVLIGGYGRGEGTPLIVDGGQEPFNDYDFVVVSVAMSRCHRNVVQIRLRRLEQQLSRDLGLPVDLQLYPANGLPRAEFSLLNYEMKYGHKVVWGDSSVLEAMPDYPHDRIPLSEGTRLLLNRGKLLLDVRRALRTGRALSAEERLRFAKFLFKAQLAFGDCALLMSRAYDLRYTIKKERIAGPLAPDVPDAAFLIERYRNAIERKEWGDFAFLSDYPLAGEFERIRQYYLRFFAWYESARAKGVAAERAALGAPAIPAPDDAAPWKAAVCNVQAFGASAFAMGTALWREHPRARLYRSLPILLGDEPVDAAAAAGLFRMSFTDREAAEARFYRLQRRFS